jgi:uncharacterized protein (DUF1778 family)
MGTQTAEMRGERLEARIPFQIKLIIQKAAELQGQTLTDFVLSSTTKAARDVIREHELLELSEKDQIAFAKSLLNPPKAGRNLAKAAREYGKSGR